jgi:hypothetical protein
MQRELSRSLATNHLQIDGLQQNIALNTAKRTRWGRIK